MAILLSDPGAVKRYGPHLDHLTPKAVATATAFSFGQADTSGRNTQPTQASGDKPIFSWARPTPNTGEVPP